MGGSNAPLTGPDLAAGVSVDQIGDAPLLGHAHGEAVLLVQRGSDIFAVSATCSHYSAPLAEGLVVDGAIRCPWHHACFDLATGRALRAPALRPIDCYEVERRADLVMIGKKRAPAQPLKGPPASPSSVVIVGGGAAGEAAASELRASGYDGPLTLLSADDSPPYDRPNASKDYLAGTAPEEWMPLRDAEYYATRQITVRMGTTVTAIDTESHTLTLGDGERLSYGALLIATGAEPRRPAVPGADLPHVHVLRSLADSRAIIAAVAAGATRAVVLGASFIGLEAAAALRTRNVAVTVVAPDERPMERILGPELADFVRALHEEHGVTFRLGSMPAAIEAACVRLTSGESLPADLVVVGVGVAPRVDLARAAGLAVLDAAPGGIVVDDRLHTSAKDVFAAGDVAAFPDPAHAGARSRIEHWALAQRQGKLAARNILGFDEPNDIVPFFWSQHYDVPINYVGSGSGWTEAQVTGSAAARDVRVDFRKGERLVAVATIYRDGDSLRAEAEMEVASRR